MKITCTREGKTDTYDGHAAAIVVLTEGSAPVVHLKGGTKEQHAQILAQYMHGIWTQYPETYQRAIQIVETGMPTTLVAGPNTNLR